MQVEGRITSVSNGLKSHVAWILNGKIICKELTCKIPLDGKTANPGFASLIFLAYNSFGSSISRHSLNIFKGNWDPSIPLNPALIKVEPLTKYNQDKVVFDKNKTIAWTTEGNAIQAYPETVTIFGPVQRNINWEGQLKTGTRSILRIMENAKEKWFVLGNSDIKFEGKNQSGITMTRGTIRSQSINKTKDKIVRNDSFIATKELVIYRDPGTDFAITRIPPPASAAAKRKLIKSIAELAQSEQFMSKIVVLSGTARFKTKKPDGSETQITEIPTGVELTVFEDGNIGPIDRPKPERMEIILKQTISPEDIIEQAKKKAEAQKTIIDLDKQLKKVEELAAREDYFEVLNELSLVEDRKNEDVRIPYYFGLANKGLYQPNEAEKYFLEASAQNSEFADGYWQLGLMYLDEKKWSEAATALTSGYDRLNSNDKRVSEYQYYAGVANFNLNAEFLARNHFMRALLWESNLEPALKASSGEFLKKLQDKKPWNLIIPSGIQYDGNALDLTSDAALPQGKTQKYLWRLTNGIMYTYDKAAANDNPGWYSGWGANFIYVHHIPSSFQEFNSFIVGANGLQTNKFFTTSKTTTDKNAKNPQENKTITSLKINESMSLLVKNKTLSTASLTLGANYLEIDTTATISYDIETSLSHNMLLREAYTFPIWANQSSLKVDVDCSSEQKFSLKVSASNSHNLKVAATPNLSIAINNLTNAKTGLAMSVDKNLSSLGEKELTIKVSPQVNISRFVMPWLLVIGSGSFDFSMIKATTIPNSKISKPSVSLMLTGML